MKNELIRGYKGLDKNFQCRGFQYKPGETYKTDRAVICEEGFHFCTFPFDVFSYYPPAENRWAEVVGSGKTATRGDDSKVACTKLHVEAEISLSSLLGAGVKFILDKVDWKNNKESNTGYYSAATSTGDQSAATNTGYYSAATNTGYHSAATSTGDRSAATNTGYYSAATSTGDRSAATNTGYRSAATNTGYQSAATNTGDRSAATVDGQDSIACGLGYQCKARGALGCWLVLAERDDDYKIKSVNSVKVDGKKIKANVFYILQCGKFVEAE
ncbi:MAG: hypothetical protein WC455_28525 [Dehalococcoidia bacterium]